MTSPVDSIAIILRFRDLVTELGGTIAEHRRLIHQHGHVWWGWWRRQAEHIPRATLAELFQAESPNLSLVLFDSGTLELYRALTTDVVVAPTNVGIQTPQFEATSGYYVRGHYPLWFRLEEDIAPLDVADVTVIGKPTNGPDSDRFPDQSVTGENLSLKALRDDRPTFWLCRLTT